MGRLAEALGVQPEWLMYGVEDAQTALEWNLEVVATCLKALEHAPPSLNYLQKARWLTEMYESELNARDMEKRVSGATPNESPGVDKSDE